MGASSGSLTQGHPHGSPAEGVEVRKKLGLLCSECS
ncbi:hypothetical protein SMAC4_13221 [Sordaria macrospora]|nr:hypothetical protein SMAC4_13221 [Sordaria macrospora]